MKTRHPKYVVAKDDTLQTISQKFGIQESAWKQYHNNMCHLEHIIRENKLPKELLKIYLLPELWEKEVELNNVIEKKTDDQIKKTSKDRVPNLNLYPQINKLSQSYWLRYIIQKNGHQTDIYYKIKICFSHRESNSNSVYIIDKISDTYINDELPNLCMEEFAYETGKAFYPIIIELGENRQLHSICNQKEIEARWKNNILPYILLRYDGEIIKKYLAKVDQIIKSKDQIEEIFRKDLFIQYLFQVYYGNMVHYERISTISFPLGKFDNIPFLVNSRLDEYLTIRGDIEITQAGVKFGKRTLSDDHFDEDSSVRYQSRGLLDKNTKLLKESVSEWNFLDENKTIKLIIRQAQE